MNREKKEKLGRIALLVTAFIWGSSFVVQKNTLDNVTPLWILALRFFIATTVIFVISIPKIKKIDEEYLKGGALIGLFLTGGFVFQIIGLTSTTPGKNAFLTATYCVLVPFLAWGIYKRKPDKYNIISGMLSLVGMGFVCLQNDLTVNVGDVLTIICGLFFALQIIVTAHYVQDRDPLLLILIQFAVATVLCLVLALLLEPIPHDISKASWGSIIYLSLMCTGACFFLQNFGQKYTPPSLAALIMVLESVFGTLLSILLGQENLTVGVAIGFVIIFIAIVISETKLDFAKKKE